MPVEKILSKITALGGAEYYLLTSLHDGGEDGMDLALVRDNQAWTGSVSKDDLKAACKVLKMDYSEFVSQTRKALTRQNVGGIDFQYACKIRNDRMTFTWKKHVSTEEIKIQLGTTVLEEKDLAFEVITEIFEHALEATTRLQSKITTLQTDNERLMTERATALKRLDKCITNKNQMEEDMYKKFAIVINDKKAKIRSLRDQLNGMHSSVPASVDSAMVGKGDRQESDDETDDMDAPPSGSENDTDDGRNTPPPEKKFRPVLKTEPSTDDSLLLEDTSAKSNTPINPRRRRRQEAASKKKTPAKPVLPKAVPKEPTPGTSRGKRASLSKGGSNLSSNASSDNMDNLFDDF